MTKFHTVKEARDVILATIQESLIENAKRFEALQKAELMKSDAGQWSASAHESSVKANAQSQQPSESERPRIAQLHVSAAARHVRAGLAHGPGAAQDHHFKQAEAHATQAHRTDVREAASSASHWTKAGQTNHSSHENAYNQKLGQVLSSATEPGKSSLQKAEFGPEDEAKYQAHIKTNEAARKKYEKDPKNAGQLATNVQVRAVVDKLRSLKDGAAQANNTALKQKVKLPRPAGSSKMLLGDEVEKCGEMSAMGKSEEKPLAKGFEGGPTPASLSSEFANDHSKKMDGKGNTAEDHLAAKQNHEDAASNYKPGSPLHDHHVKEATVHALAAHSIKNDPIVRAAQNLAPKANGSKLPTPAKSAPVAPRRAAQLEHPIILAPKSPPKVS